MSENTIRTKYKIEIWTYRFSNVWNIHTSYCTQSLIYSVTDKQVLKKRKEKKLIFPKHVTNNNTVFTLENMLHKEQHKLNMSSQPLSLWVKPTKEMHLAVTYMQYLESEINIYIKDKQYHDQRWAK